MNVAVLGGGVAGLTAAHELIDRGFEVEVYDWRPAFGGKSRSLKVPAKYPDLAGLPAEHGFRFFPGFYRHIIDTMDRICPPVSSHLTETHETYFTRVGGKPLIIPMHATPWDLLLNFRRFVEAWDLRPDDAAFFADRLLVLLTSCEERRFGEYEYLSWWDFSDAQHRSAQYQKYCAEGLSRTLVAAVAKEMSTRTAGYVLLQLIFDMARPGAQVDRVLDGPTNDVWIDPWVKDLCSRGVVFRPNTMVMSLKCVDKKITGVVVRRFGAGPEADTVITADHYVSAVPCEKMAHLLTPELRAADPTLSRIEELKVNWMNGIQLYLSKPFGGCKGHVMYADSQWALTSIAQKQFWPDVDLSQYGNKKTVDILSVDVSDWLSKGICGRTAKACKPPELEAEVIAQLVAHLNRPNDQNFDPATVVGAFVDDDIFDFPLPIPIPPIPVPIPVRMNIEPLLVNTIGSWSARPRARTRIENLFLAADYVQTYTDLATMEGANEAARRAVNAILTATGSSKEPCQLWPLQEPAIFAPLRWIDSERYRQGLPHDPAFVTWARRLLLGWQATYTSARAANLTRSVASRVSSALRGGPRG